MPNPTRETIGGSVYNDLRNLAKREGLSSADVMFSYALERFLYRLARTPQGGRHFVLKGGLLLAQFGARRATRDIDLLGRYFNGEDAEVIARISAAHSSNSNSTSASATRSPPRPASSTTRNAWAPSLSRSTGTRSIP
jgi:hypothetical protein